MMLIVTRFPARDADDPNVWRIVDGKWHDAGLLSEFIAVEGDMNVLALVAPEDARCIWSSMPDLEPRQAEGVARMRAAEHSLGAIHAVARHVGGDMVVTATIAPTLMEYGVSRLTLRGVNPDIVLPAGLAVDANIGGVVNAQFDGLTMLRGPQFAVPNEPVFRDLLVGDKPVEVIDITTMQNLLVAAGQHPLLNLREGVYAKREPREWGNAVQRKWIKGLFVGLAGATLLLGLVTWVKYTVATAAENTRALAAAQKIDPSIQDIAQAEAALDRALAQKGIDKGRFAPLAAGLWRSVKAAPNVSVRELRYGNGGILTAVLAAPDANGLNKALIAIQQDGYRITATPRRDTSGATLVDLTMRMP